MSQSSDIRDLAEGFVTQSVTALGLIWHGADIDAETDFLVRRALGWPQESGLAPKVLAVAGCIELLSPLDTPGPVTAVRDVLGQLEDLKAFYEREGES